MTTNTELKRNLIILAIIVIGIASRFIFKIPNFTAIGAIALFGGAYFKNKKLAFILPISILFISDLIIGLHNTMIFVYASFVLLIFIGTYLKHNKKPIFILGASLAGSVLFFLITNFGVWITGMGLTPSLIGVYIDGIPFFRSTIAGDLMFNAVFFTSAYLIFEKTKVLSTVNDN